MNSKIFFYLGANVNERATGIIKNNINTFLLYEKENLDNSEASVLDLEAKGRAFRIDEKGVSSARKFYLHESLGNREEILKNVLSDAKVALLRMRFLRYDLQGIFSGNCYFSDVVDYALSLIEKHNPSVLMCAYTPHTVESWLIARTFEVYGVTVIRLVSSPLSWVLLPVIGLSNTHNCVLNARNSTIHVNIIEQYLHKLKNDYKEAKPYYQVVYGDNIFLKKIFGILKKNCLKEAVKLWDKYLVFREFTRFASNESHDQNYGVFFLHLQPEANTLPEADLYCDQFQAIKKIASALPKGVKLVVREHPAFFTTRCDRRWRPAGFYERLSELPNVQICTLERDPFQVIDKAIFVASVSGVCLMEALARGKLGIFFFTPKYSLISETMLLDGNLISRDKLNAWIKELLNSSARVDEKILLESLKKISSYGYIGTNEKILIPKTAEESSMNSLDALHQAMNDVISNRLVVSGVDAESINC